MTNLEMFRGDDKSINLTFRQNGSMLNISGATVFMTIKSNYTVSGDSTAIFAFTGSEHVDSGVSGVSVVSIPAGSSDSFVPNNYVYDIQYRSPGSPYTISTVATGQFSVKPDVTRRTS